MFLRKIIQNIISTNNEERVELIVNVKSGSSFEYEAKFYC